MKTLLLTIGLMAALFTQKAPTLKLTDADVLTGPKWTGTLTYLDYSTGKPENIPVELTVTASAKGPGIYNWATVFPKETSHNSTDEVVITKDGKTFDGETVTERTVLPDGTLKFVTQADGMDNKKIAIYRITYLLGKTTYSRKKEVCYTGETTFFVRNQYSFTR
jgi:hypothetical protein